MSHKDGISYNKDTTFSQEELSVLTPEHIVDFMKLKAYGTSTPTDSMRPEKGRANSLLDYKKKISKFMPLKSLPWHPITLQGNPTRSAEVNEFINSVKKAEVRHEGKPSQATRPFTLNEFIQILDLVSSVRAEDASCRYRAVSTLQWQLIARITDVQHMTVENIVLRHDLPGVLFANIRWSKNVNEERESPTQCLFPSTEPRLCCHIALAAHCEYFFDAIPNVCADTHIFGTGKKSDNQWAQSVLRKIIDHDSFKVESTASGKLGTHGVRKGASTYISNKNVRREHVKLRGRWAMGMGVVDKYIGINLPTPDAMAAAALAGRNGPCRYIVKQEVATDVSESFLLTVVGPNITRVFGNDVGLLLSRALLFACIHCPDRVPKSIVDRVTTELCRIGIGTSTNPIKRVSFVVVQDDDHCLLEDLGDDPNGSVTQGTFNRAAAGSADAILTMLASIRRQNEEHHADIKSQIDARLDAVTKDVAAIKLQVSRAATIPAFRLGSSAASHGGEGEKIAKLIDRPMSLEVLWKEYVSGVNGTKPAREYTAANIRANPTKHCRRNAFWQVVAAWVNAGKTPEQAIDKIYKVYTPLRTVTAILAAMAKDKKTGGNAQLII